MTLKKPASSKRAPLPRARGYTKTFLKDWERLSRSGRYDMKRLKEAMLLLIGNGAQLGPEWLDHPLKGDWADHLRSDPHMTAGSASSAARHFIEQFFAFDLQKFFNLGR